MKVNLTWCSIIGASTKAWLPPDEDTMVKYTSKFLASVLHIKGKG